MAESTATLIDDPFSGVKSAELEVLLKLLEMKEARIEFAMNHHRNTKGQKMDFTACPHIKEPYNSTAREIVLQGSVQSYKAASVNSSVHTPTGWRRMGDLQVGDVVSTPNGRGAKISQIQPRGVQRLYKFILDDGREVETTRDHLWKVLRGKRRKTMSEGRKSLQWNLAKDFEVVTTEEIRRSLETGEQRFTIPVPTSPVEKPEVFLTLDPYFIGLMLGDGEIRESNIRFSNADPEILESVKQCLTRWGMTLGRDGDTDGYFFKRVEESIYQGPRLLKDLFHSLGLLNTYSHTKFIPDICKNGSVAQRLALLQGLLDTDGCACDHGGVLICLTSERLIKDIQEIVWSLGGTAKCIERESYYVKHGVRYEARNCFTLHISMPKPTDCFRLSRKKARVSEVHRRIKTMGSKIVSCEYSRDDEVQCIVLDDADHLYIMDSYIVTHNSEWAVIDHLAAAYVGLSVFFVIPKFDMRTTYVQNRIDRCVESVPEYKKIMGAGFFSSVAMKHFGKGTIKYVGSNVMADFTEFPADMLVVEEVDECHAENLDYALDRLRASKYQFKRYLGNPNQIDKGINKMFLLSDQREWNVHCRDCGELSELDWFQCVAEEELDKEGNIINYRLRDKTWEPGCRRDIRLMCPKCGVGELDRADSNGAWVPKNPSSGVAGYHISMLCSLINSIAGMWVRFQAAIHDPQKMQAFYNSDLGLPFSSIGNKVTETLLTSCAEKDYNFIIDEDCAYIPNNEHVGPCSMGIDVGGVFDVRISHVDNHGKRTAVFIGKVKHLDDLYELIDRYNVQAAVMDSMPEITVAQDFQELAKTNVWLCRYKGEGTDRRRSYDTIDKIIHSDRTEALDRSFAQLRQKRNILPENYNAIMGGRFTKEMCAPVRMIVTDDRGNDRYEWSKCVDHSRHSDTYDMLAGTLLLESVIDEVSIG